MSITTSEKRIDYFQSLYETEPEFCFEFEIENKLSFEVLRFTGVENDILYDSFLYITNGISDVAQPGTTNDIKFKTIEFSAYSDYLIKDKTIEDSDFIADIIFEIASFPFNNNTAFEQGQTFDFGRPIIPNSELEGFYFASPPFIKYINLFENTGTAKSILHLIPISRKEMEFKLEHGVEKFLKLMSEKDIEPFMDLRRKSCI